MWAQDRSVWQVARYIGQMAEAGGACGAKIGKYRLVEPLAGGEGQAILRYRAEHETLGRTVEIHVLAPGESGTGVAAARLLRAARVLGGAHHRNLRGVLDTGRTDDERPYVVYESLRGESLRAILDAHPDGLGTERAAAITVQILEGVRALHGAGVVLRTFRPADATLEPDTEGRDLVKLRASEGAALTADGEAAPLPRQFSPYLAPELRRGLSSTDPRLDLFSVGIILRELLTGRPTGDDGGLSDTARRALNRALADDSDERFATADGFLQAVALMLPQNSRPAREQLPMPDDPLQADLQYLHLRRITRHGPKVDPDAESRVRLLPVLLTIEALYRRFGQEVWSEVTQRVDEAEALLPGAGNTPVHVEKGVPVPLFSEILFAVDDVAGEGDLSLIAELGEAVARRGLDRLCPKLPRPYTPDAVVAGFPYLWSRIGHDGKASVQTLSASSARLAIRGQSTPSLELSGLLAGLFREAMRMAGAEEVELLLISSDALGDGLDLYGLSWR